MTAPIVKSLSIDKKVVRPGDSIFIEIEAEDAESSISETNSERFIQVKKQDGGQSDFGYFVYNETTNRYEAQYQIKENAIHGKWEVSYIHFEDVFENTYAIFPKVGDSLYQSFRVATDIVAPNQPTINEYSDSMTILTGTAEIGSLVTVTNDGLEIGSTVTNNRGIYTIALGKQVAGSKLVVYAMDEAENESESNTIIVLDKTAPTQPKVSAVTDQTKVVTGEAVVADIPEPAGGGMGMPDMSGMGGMPGMM